MQPDVALGCRARARLDTSRAGRRDAPIAQRLGDMQPAQAGAGLEIGQRAGHAKHAVIAPGRELEAFGRGGEQLAALGIGAGERSA